MKVSRVIEKMVYKNGSIKINEVSIQQPRSQNITVVLDDKNENSALINRSES